MDPVLPFRVLSPGTRKPNKLIHQRLKESKLSLKSRKAVKTVKENKENNAPSTSRGRTMTMPARKYVDSNIMTSDESDSENVDEVLNSKHNSIMSLNTQESTFSLPVAESTRCEFPAKLSMMTTIGSTMASMHTAEENSLPNHTEYFTAYPFPVGCDESIVCLSDSSLESLKKTVKKSVANKIPCESVLLTSDESNDESEQCMQPNIANNLAKCLNKLCDTVLLDSSDDDCDSDFGTCIREKSDSNFVIPPSIKSNDSSLDSSINHEGNILDPRSVVIPPSPERCSEAHDSLISEDSSFDHNFKTFDHGSVVIPPSPERCSEAPDSLKSDDADISTSFAKNKCIEVIENSCLIAGKPESGGISKLQVKSPAKQNSFMFSGKFLEPESNESSWKDDLNLDISESICHDRQLKPKQETHKTHLPSKSSSNISKEKYNDIARWLFSGKDSCGSDFNDLAEKQPELARKETANDTDRPKHPQVHRLSVVRRPSFGSESDDNFEAFMDSVKKNKNKDCKPSLKCDNVAYEDSFINDECASDVAESPSFNVYHSDLTKSIRAEVCSVKKSVKSMKKRLIYGHLDSSDDRIGKERSRSPETRHKSSEPDSKPNKNKYHSVSDTEDSSDTDIDSDGIADLSPAVAIKKHRDVKEKSEERRKGSRGKTSNVSDSESEEPITSKIQNWRKNLDHSSGTDSSSSASSVELPSVRPKRVPKSSKTVKKPLPRVPAGLVARKITALKSPQTPRSPIRTFLTSLSGPTHEPGVRDHPEAGPYNSNFKTKKEELTRRLFKLFNREVFERRLPDDMVLEWNARLVRTAGLCYCKLVRKREVTTRTAKIALSTKVITSPDRLRDTLIHEMCHAAVWLLNNVSGGHGPFWKAWAHKAMKRFPELPPIARCHTYKIETKFTYKCTQCGYSFGRHSKSLDMNKKRCGYCYGSFEVFLTSKGPINQRENLKTPKAPNAFALFVKEKYGLLKKEDSGMKHGEIMKKLGDMFATLKMKPPSV